MRWISVSGLLGIWGGNMNAGPSERRGLYRAEERDYSAC